MNSGVQHKLLSYEVAPPPGAWNKIAAELDESELDHVFPSTLYKAEVIPPVGAWSKIQTTLNAEQEASIPERRWFSPLLRYTVAAALIGLIVWGGVQLLNTKSSGTSVAKTELAPAIKEKQTTTLNQLPGQTTEKIVLAENNNQTDEVRNDAALEASKKTFAKLDRPVSSRLKNIAAAYQFSSMNESENLPGINNPEDCPPDMASRYITLATTEGNTIRISKKLSDLACCVSGEDANKECKDQMSRWREKIACSTTGHSTGSFLDILNLVNSLQDQ